MPEELSGYGYSSSSEKEARRIARWDLNRHKLVRGVKLVGKIGYTVVRSKDGFDVTATAPAEPVDRGRQQPRRMGRL